MPLSSPNVQGEPFVSYGRDSAPKDVRLDAELERERVRVDRLDHGHGIQAVTLAEHGQILKSHTTAIEDLATTMTASHTKLSESMNKVLWTLVGTALTVATSAIGVSTALVLTGGPG